MDITVIDDSDTVGWLAAAVRFGEIYITDVKDMASKVTKAAGTGSIDSLTVLDHGWSNGFQIGSDTITAGSLGGFAPELSKVAAKMSSSGHIQLQNCMAGQADALLKSFAKLMGVSVYATPNVTSFIGVNMGYTQWTGALTGRSKGIGNPFKSFEVYYRYDPDGATVDRDADLP